LNVPRPWIAKFRDAVYGCALAVRGQSSFGVHLAMAGLVIVAAAALRVSLIEWCLLGLCIVAVLAAELFNTAIEYLAKAVNPQHDPNLGKALDIASGAVLLAALGAAAVGSTIFIYRLGILLAWWAGGSEPEP
jgi:diacylglycerol kinase